MNLTAIPVSLCQFVVQLDCFVKIFNGFLILSEFDKKQSPVEIRYRVIGLEFDRSIVRRHGLFVFFVPEMTFRQLQLIFGVIASCRHKADDHRQCN